MNEETIIGDIVREVAEPMLFINRNKQIIFATKSFEDLIGRSDLIKEQCECDFLMIPSVSPDCNHLCCWDVIDIYLTNNESGLWLLKRGDGSLVPVLCSMESVKMGDRKVFVVLTMKPLCSHSPNNMCICYNMGLGFFRSMINSRKIENYLDLTIDFFRKSYSLKSIVWLDMKHGFVEDAGIPRDIPSEKLHNVIFTTLKALKNPTPFDVTVHGNKKSYIFHIFPPSRTREGRVLLVRNIGKITDRQVISNILCAVDVANSQLSNLKIDPASECEPVIFNVLSEREKEVLVYLTKGMTDRETAAELHISIHTVKNHVRSIMCKLNVNKRTKLIKFCLTHLETDIFTQKKIRKRG